jgi:tRNA nucleotidyltransferase (CCA-adding enzyme)
MTHVPDQNQLAEPSFTLQLDPGLAILRMAALSAEPEGALDDETLELMFERVEAGLLMNLPPPQIWTELQRGLLGATPSNMFRALYACGALAQVMPEVAALFGVPQIADDPPQVDIGYHLTRVLDHCAQCHAPLAVRFAALVMHVGKADSPPEHLPVHYRHIDRGLPRIEAICARFGLPADCRELALLALVECERVHRVSEVRAGPIAAMLTRLGAFDDPSRYHQLLSVCACDYRAYRGREYREYPKATLLEIARKACTAIDITPPREHAAQAAADDALYEARAAAIATAFGSIRWSD